MQPVVEISHVNSGTPMQGFAGGGTYHVNCRCVGNLCGGGGCYVQHCEIGNTCDGNQSCTVDPPPSPPPPSSPPPGSPPPGGCVFACRDTVCCEPYENSTNCPEDCGGGPIDFTINGFVGLDANKDGIWNDGDANKVEDTFQTGCPGSFYNLSPVADLRIAWVNNSVGGDLGVIDYHTGCPPSYSMTRQNDGMYNFTLNNLPAGYHVAAIQVSGTTCTLSGNTAICGQLSDGNVYTINFLIQSDAPVCYNPKGYHDSSYCDAPAMSYGWTCDQDNYAAPLLLDFYVDSPAGSGHYLGSTIANIPAEQGVCDACGGYCNHRFNYPTPEYSSDGLVHVKDGNPHTIYAYAINSEGCGNNILLSGSPKTITCTPHTCTVTSNASCSDPLNGNIISTTWNANPQGFSIEAIQGRFDRSPFDNIPFPGGEDTVINWGTGTTGTQVATVIPGTQYRVNTGVFDEMSDWPSTPVCTSPPQSLTCCPNAPNPPGLSCTVGDNAVNFIMNAAAQPPPVTDYNISIPGCLTGQDVSAPYTKQCPGNPGDTFTATAYSKYDPCTSQSGVVTRACTILAQAWWQLKDSDVLAFGDLESDVPAPPPPYFDEAGVGGTPGVVAYSGDTNLTTANVSSTGWLADTPLNTGRVYNASYFINALPADLDPWDININTVPGGTFSDTDKGTLYMGYYWYEYNGGGTLTINSDASLGGRKVVLIVRNGNLLLGGNINLAEGTGFFLALVNGNAPAGNISVNPATVGGGATPNLEGIYIADGSFSSGSRYNSNQDPPVFDTQLRVRGTIAAYRGINLQRNIGSDASLTTSSEYFEFAPDLELLFPPFLGYRMTSWQEVAP